MWNMVKWAVTMSYRFLSIRRVEFPFKIRRFIRKDQSDFGHYQTRPISRPIHAGGNKSRFGTSLKTADAVEKAVGKYIHVKLYQAIDKIKVFEGTLLSFEGTDLIMEYMDKTRKKEVTIPYQTVAKARLAVKL